jgi:hypothetical protein
VVERAPQEAHARRPAGARLVANRALDGLEVAEPPELEGFLDVDEQTYQREVSAWQAQQEDNK